MIPQTLKTKPDLINDLFPVIPVLGWGTGIDILIGRVATLLNVDQDIVPRPVRYPNTVEARSVLCYWAARELGISTLELSKRLGISQPTASQSVKRGEKIVKEKQLKVMG